MKNVRKTVITSLTVILLAGNLLAPVAIGAGSASLNGFNADQPVTQISNSSNNPGCAECWTPSINNVDDGDIVSILVYYHNTGPDTAENVRVRVQQSNITPTTVTFAGRIWADNAGAKAQTVSATVTSGDELESVEFVDASWYPNRSVSNPTSISNVVTQAAGYNIGNVTFSWGTTGTVVVRYRINSNGGDDNGGNGDFTVDTRGAEDVDKDSAELVCRVETGDEDAEIWFEWGEDDDDLDEDTNKIDVDADETNTVRKTITGLDEDTRYFFRCIGEDNDGNEEKGDIESFSTDDEGNSNNDDAPDVTTLSATAIDSVSGTLRCEVDPNGDDTEAWFEWGTSSSNLNRDTSKEDIGSGTSDVNHSTRITGLVNNTTYYYRCIAENGEDETRGSILNFRTTAPVVNVVTRFIDVFRDVEPEPEVQALIITLDTDNIDNRDREVGYTVSYENKTNLTLRNAVLVVELPNELDFINSDPNADDENRNDLTFNIGTITPDEQDSFFIETEVASNVDENDVIRFVGHVEYNDDGSARKIVEVVDESTYGELLGRGGGLTATLIDSLRNFFTSPILWLFLFILMIFFAIRYLLSAKDRRGNALV